MNNNFKHTNFYVIIFNSGYSHFFTFDNKQDARMFKRGFEEGSESHGGNPSVYVYPCEEAVMMNDEEEALDALTAIGKQ